MKIIYTQETTAFKPSHKLHELILFIENNSNIEIWIKFSDIYNGYPNSAFYSESKNNIVTLHIASKLFKDKKNVEQSIAHEAGHALLSKVYNYPSMIINTDDYYKINNINQIRNSIEDIIINILLENFGFDSHGLEYYTSISSEIDYLKNGDDPYYQIDPGLKTSFIFSRIILALGYLHMIEDEEENRNKLHVYLGIMEKHFQNLYNDAEKSLFVNENKSIIPKHRYKESIEAALSYRNLIQFVNIVEANL